jgi:cytoskeletal protein CcmA (bactofilin family)
MRIARRLMLGALLLGGIWLLGSGLVYASSNCTGPGQSSFGGDITIAASQHICGDVNTAGGTVIINGTVDGNVNTAGGNVIVHNLVNGNISSLGGNVTVTSTGHVTGNIDAFGGSIQLFDHARVDGDVRSFGSVSRATGAEVGGSIEYPQQHGLNFAEHSNSFGFPLLAILIWALLGSGVVMLMPERVALIRSTIAIQATRSLAVGALSVVLVALSAVILAITVIGIPAALVMVLGMIVAWVLGKIALGLFIGEWLMYMLAPRQRSKVMEVIAGLAILELLENIPFVGSIIWIVAGLVGLGAVLLSRFGARLYGLRSAPPYARHA